MSLAATVRSRPLAAAAGVTLAAHLLAALLLGETPAGSAASNHLQAIAAALASFAAMGAAQRSPGLARRFWILVATAMAIWTVAQIFYSYHENWMGERVPQLSWAHLLFRVYGAPLLMALLIGDEDEQSTSLDGQRVLDFAQVGILFLFFYFEMFSPGGDWRSITTLSIWGFLDLADAQNWALFLAFLGRSRLARSPSERALARQLVPYLMAYAVGAAFSNYMYWMHGTRTGSVIDLVFTSAMFIGVRGAESWVFTARETSQGEISRGRINWLAATLPLLILAMALPMARYEPTIAFVAVFGSVSCFGARMLITLYRRRRLVEQLQMSESRYASLLNLAPDAIFVHTAGRITFANPSTARLLGLKSAADAIGRHVLDFAPPELREAYSSRLGGSDTAPISLQVLRSDGVRVYLEAVGMNIRSGADPRALPTRLVIARDVTERRKAEAERESLIHALELKNAELERFTYTVSHDLRSPLVTIGSYISHVEEAAARGDLSSLREDVERIRRASLKMDMLLKDLLELSRIGHVMAPPDSFSFSDAATEAAALVHGRLSARSVEVVIDPAMPEVHGDRLRLVEVLQNLLDNAAKFMGDQVAPKVEVGARLEDGQTVFFVRDNGQGIDPTHHDRIFGLFDKLDPKGPGTGVGLALVKRIIELHRGRIWVRSEGPGRGTTFSFTLPLARDR